MPRANQLEVDRACVLMIDLQEKLLPLIADRQRLLKACRKLLDGVRIFELPVVATEQYPHGLGPTHETLRLGLEATRATVVEKPTFSGWAHPAVRNALAKLGRPQVVVAGIEAHVCVQQTALDLAASDYQVFVCADAIGSRGPMDFEMALHRMRQGGVYVTTVESVLFELCGRCDTARFKQMLEVIKATPPEG